MSGLAPISPSAAASQTQILNPAMQLQSQANAFGNIGSLTGGGAQGFQQYFPGGARRLTQQQVNDPFAPQAMAGAQQAAQFGGAAAANQFATGGWQQDLGSQVAGMRYPLEQGAQQVMQAGFDPQSALYNRYLQLQQQQSAAGYAASGVGSTPYAAGLQDQNLQNFNTTWNSYILGNETSALNAATNAYGTAGNLASTGANIQNMGMQAQAGAGPLAMQSALYPYLQSILQSQTGMQALSGLMQYGQGGAGLTQQSFSDYINLLGLVPQQQQANTNAALAQSQIQQTLINELGKGIAGGFNMLGGTSGISSGLSNLGGLLGVPGGSMFSQH